MTYSQALQTLYTRLPVFHISGSSAYKPGLERTLSLLNRMGNPHADLTTVHVAGTNGKGSVSHMVCSVLMQAGYRCGLFTSPHIKDFRERISISGKVISEEYVIQFTQKNLSLFETLRPSFFEVVTAMGCSWFKKQSADICIIETGMGGRLDSTNVISPLVCAITSVGMDHAAYLGNTLQAIAFEKAGIIKPGIPVVIGRVPAETRSVIQQVSDEKKAPLWFCEDNDPVNYETDLAGDFQKDNLQVVYRLCMLLNERGFHITEQHIAAGLKNTVRNTHLRGRYEKHVGQRILLFDAAHNPPAMKALMQSLHKEKYENLHIVLGMSGDKEVGAVLKELPRQASYYFTQAQNPRALSARELHETALTHSRTGGWYTHSAEAMNHAVEKSNKNDLILVTGSFYLLAELLP